MKPSKKHFAAMVSVLFVMNNSLFGQQWEGPNNTTDAISRSGNIGIGTSPSYGRLHIKTTAAGQGRAAIFIDRPDANSEARLWFGTGGSTWWFLGMHSNDDTQKFDLYNDGPWGSLQTWDPATGNVGIGTYEPSNKLHVNDPTGIRQNRLYFSGGDGWSSLSYNAYHNATNSGWVFPDPARPAITIEMDDAGNVPRFQVYSTTSSDRTNWLQRFAVDGNSGNVLMAHSGGNVGIGTNTPQTKLDVNGTTRTQIIEITGGSDLAEPFEIAKTESVAPGTIVCIDSENPGKLMVSTKAYDRRVAGIVSGARGLNPGMLMTQSDSEINGKYPVALTGRVYCLVDAANGSIEPGDLLTTSNTPGHAMKATDYQKAQGAILGKAMSSLESGRGLVLVLVTLQ